MSYRGTKHGEADRKVFYRTAVHFIFAIIVAQSFVIASEVVVPVQSIPDGDNALRTFSLALSYVMVITGWVGYSRSMSVKPHKDTYKGAARFILDIVILFEYFYLLQISTTVHFGEQFHIVLLSIFATYLAWDAVKYYEYPGKIDRKVTARRGSRTLVCSAACLAIAVAYGAFGHGWPSPPGPAAYGGTPLAVTAALMIALVVCYRLWKWNVSTRRTHR